MVLPIPLATATLFGDPPTVGNFRDAALFSLLAGVVGAAGPFVIWLLRRTRPWLYGAIAILVLMSLLAAYFFNRSQDAPSDRQIGSFAPAPPHPSPA